MYFLATFRPETFLRAEEKYFPQSQNTFKA